MSNVAALSLLTDELLVPKQAASFLKCSVSTLARWRADGVGPRYVKLTEHRKGAVRYRASDLADYIARFIRETSSE